jgi:MraZ protein
LILVGEYEITLDSKNRINVPAEIRRMLVPKRDGEEFYIVTGINLRTWLYPDRVYENMVAKQQSPKMAPDRESLEFVSLNFGIARKVEPDKQGRISLPPETADTVREFKEPLLVGMQDHMQLWDKTDWREYRNGLLKARAAEAMKPKPKPPEPPTTA